ncbi:hypothetical protein M011DRAFT_81888 [Sporormia fimetaria CBS 119925]|uniref:Uncharacterized protein n=1 Tax=Sporormia fimetaria CBS 119925 TaxID=1340428 RepID=A0A6A6V9S3_9PLEO|nr:hypothetical protein M011DRAFT_81888 [Sporormia fimetaria CBS 119925]
MPLAVCRVAPAQVADALAGLGRAPAHLSPTPCAFLHCPATAHLSPAHLPAARLASPLRRRLYHLTLSHIAIIVFPPPLSESLNRLPCCRISLPPLVCCCLSCTAPLVPATALFDRGSTLPHCSAPKPFPCLDLRPRRESLLRHTCLDTCLCFE